MGKISPDAPQTAQATAAGITRSEGGGEEMRTLPVNTVSSVYQSVASFYIVQ